MEGRFPLEDRLEAQLALHTKGATHQIGSAGQDLKIEAFQVGLEEVYLGDLMLRQQLGNRGTVEFDHFLQAEVAFQPVGLSSAVLGSRNDEHSGNSREKNGRVPATPATACCSRMVR